MSSQEQSFNGISLLLLETQGFFQNHLIVSVLKLPLNYVLADSSNVVHHTSTSLLEKN